MHDRVYVLIFRPRYRSHNPSSDLLSATTCDLAPTTVYSTRFKFTCRPNCLLVVVRFTDAFRFCLSLPGQSHINTAESAHHVHDHPGPSPSPNRTQLASAVATGTLPTALPWAWAPGTPKTFILPTFPIIEIHTHKARTHKDATFFPKWILRRSIDYD
jgi:hypothetical protein